MGRERRRHNRYPARIPVVLRSGSRDHRYLSEDVSVSGLFLRTDAPPRLRQLVQITMALPPEGKPFKALAMCVFVVPPGDPDRAPGVGVQFYGFSEEQEATWAAFVEDARRGATVELEPMAAQAEVPDAIRRRDERYAAIIAVEPVSLEELAKMYTRDVSRGGMFLMTEHVVPVGTVIRLDVRHPKNDEVFDLACEVRRVESQGDERGLGVEFVGMDGARREAFHKFVYDLLEVEEPGETVGPGDPKLV